MFDVFGMEDEEEGGPSNTATPSIGASLPVPTATSNSLEVGLQSMSLGGPNRATSSQTPCAQAQSGWSSAAAPVDPTTMNIEDQPMTERPGGDTVPTDDSGQGPSYSPLSHKSEPIHSPVAASSAQYNNAGANFMNTSGGDNPSQQTPPPHMFATQTNPAPEPAHREDLIDRAAAEDEYNQLNDYWQAVLKQKQEEFDQREKESSERIAALEKQVSANTNPEIIRDESSTQADLQQRMSTNVASSQFGTDLEKGMSVVATTLRNEIGKHFDELKTSFDEQIQSLSKYTNQLGEKVMEVDTMTQGLQQHAQDLVIARSAQSVSTDQIREMVSQTFNATTSMLNQNPKMVLNESVASILIKDVAQQAVSDSQSHVDTSTILQQFQQGMNTLNSEPQNRMAALTAEVQNRMDASTAEVQERMDTSTAEVQEGMDALTAEVQSIKAMIQLLSHAGAPVQSQTAPASTSQAEAFSSGTTAGPPATDLFSQAYAQPVTRDSVVLNIQLLINSNPCPNRLQVDAKTCQTLPKLKNAIWPALKNTPEAAALADIDVQGGVLQLEETALSRGGYTEINLPGSRNPGYTAYSDWFIRNISDKQDGVVGVAIDLAM